MFSVYISEQQSVVSYFIYRLLYCTSFCTCFSGEIQPNDARNLSSEA